MADPQLPHQSGPLGTLAAVLFPFDASARQLLFEAIDQTFQSKLDEAMAAQAESKKREERKTAQEGADLIGITRRHLLRLAARNEIKGHRVAGQRRVYFTVGDLLDWKAANTRADGQLKYTTPKSGGGAKQKGR